MSLICWSFPITIPPQRQNNGHHLFILRNFKRTTIRFVSSSSSSSLPKQNQVVAGYDPSEALFEFEVDLKPRQSSWGDTRVSEYGCNLHDTSLAFYYDMICESLRNPINGVAKLGSWFGPNGQYIRELPCPSCRGRGYTPCEECGIERSRSDCALCNGKGIMMCRQCLGDCVIWEESIDERPWEKARSVSPLKVKEDDDVDKLDIKLKRRKSKRVYQSTTPEVVLKISRTLRSLNARTGLFTNRMKIIHADPKLHAERVAAIKKAKGTPTARKHASDTLKAFFLDPENRQKRSISMKGLSLSTICVSLYQNLGVKFFCKNCGREGHRSHYCPELKDMSNFDRRFKCRLCGERGHNKRTCFKSTSTVSKSTVTGYHRCGICNQSGHNRRRCPQLTVANLVTDETRHLIMPSKVRSRACRLCQVKGHNRRTCPNK